MHTPQRLSSDRPRPRAYIVDDDQSFTRAVARALDGLGYDVAGIAHDAAAALAGIPATRPDLVIMDVNLGGGDSGIAVAERLRDDGGVPIVFLTGVCEPDLEPLAAHDRVFGYLPKPFSPAVFRATVDLVRMQHEARGRLQELERHYHALFDQAAVGVAQLDAETGRLVDVNLKCAAIFGTTPERMIGRDVGELADPGELAAFRAALQALDHGEGREHVAELLARRDDGRPVWVRLTVSPLAAPGPGRGAATCDRVVIIQDMSASRESEARERVAHEANRAKTDFLAHMSHELRTPLNAVLGLSEALLERIFGELNDAQARTLATIHDSGRHLLELINDVLDIARVEAGTLPIEPEQVVLRPLIEESTALIYGQLTRKGQRLRVELGAALPPVDIDRRRIKQVLLNLLGNAVKFSPPGAAVTVQVDARPSAREVEVSVSDDGPGISPDDQARIFEPFVTLDPSMSRSHDGAGLGLALTKRIVELHGGRVAVTSAPGQGSTFTITLPVSSAYAGEPWC